jgi:hypothetical protein
MLTLPAASRGGGRKTPPRAMSTILNRAGRGSCPCVTAANTVWPSRVRKQQSPIKSREAHGTENPAWPRLVLAPGGLGIATLL